MVSNERTGFPFSRGEFGFQVGIHNTDSFRYVFVPWPGLRHLGLLPMATVMVMVMVVGGLGLVTDAIPAL